MTARVTTLKGPEAGAYYVEALPSYYLQSGEPRGQWHGRGAAILGLSGPTSDADFLAVMAGEHPGRPGWSLGRRYGESSVRGFDVTCSAPKSVSILFAVGDEKTRSDVLEGHDRAVTAVVDWIERNALTRYRIGGEVAMVDAQGIAAATFRQHTSRALDPQLHTHVVVANRVLSPDGRWLALDARGLKLDQRTASAIYHASLQAELTRRIGVEWVKTEHSISEIGAIPTDAITAFSQRTDSIRRRVDTKIDRFIDTMDREPTPRERWRLEREAVIDSRPAKAGSIDAEALHTEWAERLEALDITFDQLQRDCLNRETALDLHPDIAHAVITDAVAALEATQSTWRPAELTREIARQLPTNIGHTPDRAPRPSRHAHQRWHRAALRRHLPTDPGRRSPEGRRPTGERISRRPGTHHPNDPRPRTRRPQLGSAPVQLPRDRQRRRPHRGQRIPHRSPGRGSSSRGRNQRPRPGRRPRRYGQDHCVVPRNPNARR